MEDEDVKNLRRLSQSHAYTSLQMHEAVGRKAGLPGTDHKYLGFLLQKGQMTAGEFSSLTGLTTGAITGLIDRLEKLKLVKREFAEEDRRKVFIVPNTKKIMALLEPLYREFRSETEKFIASLTEKEARVIERYLSRSIELMEETTNKINKSK